MAKNKEWIKILYITWFHITSFNHKVSSFQHYQRRGVYCSHELEVHGSRLKVAMTNQESTQITISLQYCSNRPFNSYYEESVCTMCELPIISNPCYWTIMSKCHIWVTQWNYKCSCTVQ